MTARYVLADGKIDKMTTTRVGTALQGDHDGAGLRELFWDMAMRYHTAPGAQAAVRRAAACATTRCLNLGNAPDAEAWHALRRVMGGEVPSPTMQERTEEGLRRRAHGEAAASEAEKRTRAAHAQDAMEAATRARRAQTSRHATPRVVTVSEEAERLRAAASTLGVTIDAPAKDVRRAYLLAAIRAHPDKAGGSNPAFIALRDALERINGATEETRHRAALEVQQAQGTATQAIRRARHDAVDTAPHLSEAVVLARDEASRRALSDWIPGWKRAAGHLRSANRAYMDLWLQYQKQVLRALNEQAQGVPGASYKTHAERAAAEAVERRATRRQAREQATRAAVDAMRERERRAAHDRRAAAIAAAHKMRERSETDLRLAIQEDEDALTRSYRVRVPYAAWTQHKDDDSDRYILYDIAEITQRGGTVQAILERTDATYAERRTGTGKYWDRIQVTWQELTGVTRFGAAHKGCELEPKGVTDDTSEEDAQADEEEQALERGETRRATREATRHIARARAAARAAARILRDADRRDAPGDAAEEALRYEEAEIPEVHSDTSDGEGYAHEQERDATAHGTRDRQPATNARRRGAWSGRNWAREAWMGSVAAAEYAAAWRSDSPERPPRSAAAEAAGRAAQQTSIAANTDGGTRASLATVRETQRRTGRLWHAAQDACDADVQRRATALLTSVTRAWREANPQAQDTPEAAHTAVRAADELQRRRPAENSVATAARKRSMLEAAKAAYAMSALPECGDAGNTAEDGAREQAKQVLRRMQQGHSPPEGCDESDDAYVVMVDMMTAIFEQAARGAPSQDGTPPTRLPPRPAPRGHEADARESAWDDASEMDVPVPATAPPTHISIHVGNLRDRYVPRPWGADDRRVDRSTPFGNPFPLRQEDDLHERNLACDAYEEVLRGDPQSTDVQAIADGYGLQVDRHRATTSAVRELHHAIHQLAEDVAALPAGRSIRLMCHCAPRRCHAHSIAKAVRDLLHGRGVRILADDGERASAEAAFGTHSRLVTESAAHTENSEGDHDGDAAAQTNGDVSDRTRRTEMHTAMHTSRSNAPSGAGTTADRAPSQLIDKLSARLNEQRNKKAFETFMRTLPNPTYFRVHQGTAADTDTVRAAHGLEMDDELTNEPHEAGADDEGTGAMAQGDEQDERSNCMDVVDETPMHDAESAQQREVEVPVERVKCAGDSGGETIRGHESVRDAKGRGGADGGEQRERRGARPPRKRAKGEKSQRRRQDDGKQHDRAGPARREGPALPSGEREHEPDRARAI